MDYGKAFTFAFEDEEWIKKIGIGAVLVLGGFITGFLLIPVLGWTIEITRRVIKGDPNELPDWSEFGQYFADGFKFMVITFVWALPMMLIIGCSAGGAALMAEQLGEDTAGLILAGGVCLSLPFALLFLLIPAARGILADTGSLGQAINPLNAFKVFRGNIGGYLIGMVILMVVGSVLPNIGLLLCGVGILVTTLYQYLVGGHLFGQAYREATNASGGTGMDMDMDVTMQAPI